MLPRPLHQILAFSFAYPRVTVSLWAGVTVVAVVAVGLLLRIDTGTTTFLDRGSPEWQVYQKAVRDFGGDEYLAISIKGTRPYDWDLLARLEPLSANLSEIPGVRRVDSLATVPLVRMGAGGAIATAAALESGIPVSDSKRGQLVRHIKDDPIARRFLISEDGRHVGISVMLDEELNSNRAATVERIRAMLVGLPAAIAGVPVFRTEVNDRTQIEVEVFVPATILLIAVVTYLWVRSFMGVVGLLAAGAAGSSVSLAAMACMGVPLSLSTMLLPSVLLALGCAYAGHVLVAAARDGVTFDSVALVVPGIAWSGVTTAIGFAAMSATSVDAIRQLAAYGALGVFCVAAAAISLVPAVLAMSKRGPHATRLMISCGAAGVSVASGSARNTVPVIAAWVLLAGLVGAGATRLAFDTNIIEWFGESDPIRAEYESIREDFSGITPVSVVLRSTDGSKMTDPDVLGAIDQLVQDLESRDVVGRALGISQPLRSFREAFGRDGLPESSSEAEQYLLLLGAERRVSDLVSNDRSAASIWIRMDSNDSQDIVGMREWIEQWWGRFGADGVSAETTGVMYEFARAQEAIASSQVRGLAIAVIAVGVVLCVALQSLRLALVAMIPNALPIGLAFGGMGLLGVPIDAATVCLGSLALGIAVDDTVHVMLAVRGEESSGATDGELGRQLSSVVPALMLTTACIAIGFGVLGFSSFTLVRNLGLVTAVVVVLCLAADLSLLPALLARRRWPAVGQRVST